MFKKRNLFFLALMFATTYSVFAGSMKKLKSFGNNPGNLSGYIYVPTKHSDHPSLVIALHGCNQSVKTIADESAWNELAEKNGFIVLYPSQKTINNPSRCFNWFDKKNTAKNSGEMASLKSMIDYAIVNYAIDTSKIYVYGLSAGAVMGVALMTNYPNYFKAGAIYSGGPFNAIDNPLQALSMMHNSSDKSAKLLAKEIAVNNDSNVVYPKLIVLHGKQDNVNTIKNSYLLMHQWMYLCKADTIVDHTDLNFQHIELTRTVYNDLKNREKIVFYEFKKSGHWLSVDPGDGLYQGGKTGIFARDDDFFSTYWIAKEFDLVEK